MRSLPPLGALRAFEAAARHLSFTRAAAELCVTQAAISHQVRQLEQWLGQPLFTRKGHTLSLTHKGAAYLTDLSLAFDNLAAATERVREARVEPLRITVLPSFATRWLLPRLPAFRARHPDVDLRVTSAVELWSGDGEFDIGIRSGLGRWPGVKADLIAREFLSPVCSPEVAKGPPMLAQPADLAGVPLLHDQPRAAWRQWCEHANVALDLSQGVAFNDAALVLQAAAEGQGVVLGRLMLAGDALRAGRLVRLFDHALPNDYSYWIVYSRAAAQRSDVSAFRGWLLEEARQA
ncbi:transcriptional regulator GcvA [Achromobacter sp. NPDC058515]|uniref:transcriptional regulator GcvA n=1 Tax=Achromobacter sp. NPDC058515 TaxID=3346533 RepID=UPI0036522AF7